ncbi:phenylacetyl-CoA ligase [Mycena galericulata]|nr:phenylacetyl-CoA ligase [Mycena galericulata]
MTVYQSTVGNLDLPADHLTVPEFILDSTFLQPRTGDATHPDWVCLIEELTGRKVHFSELRSRTAYLSAALSEQHIIFALVASNHIDYPVCVWAAHRLGAIVATLNPSMTTEELAHQLKIARPSVIIVQNESVSLAKDAAHHAGLGKYHIIVMDATMGSDSEYHTIDSLITLGTSLPPFYQQPLHKGEAKTKVAFLSFSSGTTGLPKESTHIFAPNRLNILQVAALNHVYDSHLQWADKRYSPGGVCSGDIYGLVVNMTLVVSAKFNFEKMLDSISRYQITNLMIVPPQALLISKHPVVSRYDLSSVRACMIAAAPISAELTQSFLRVLPGIHLGQGYGMTETCAAVSMFPLSPKVGILGSAGKLVPGTIAKVVKDDGTLASIGERGELYVQGPQELFINGWLRTGDEVYFDNDENLFIVDRIKELIKVKGHQVAPAELEGHLLGHKNVIDAAVIGIPDEYSGELPFAFVVLTPRLASQVKEDPTVLKNVQENIFKHVSTSKSSYKWLTGGIRFVDAIPKSASGKILRRLLREQAGVFPRSKL